MPAIRQQINIATSPRTVWRALTTAEGLMSWWVDEARVDAREGGRIVLTSEGEDGAPLEERGLFLTIRPTRKIEIAWDRNSPAETRATRIEFNIGKDGDDTRVSVIHSGAGPLDDEAARAVLDKAWRSALQTLRQTLEEA